MNMNIKRRILVKRVLFIVLLVLWMALIFGFSSRNADTSARDSMSVGQTIGRIFVPGFRDWTEEKQLAFAEKIDHPVRKCAHASEYAVLGLLWVPALRAFGLPKRRIWWMAWLFSTAYAGTDEFHQLFVTGRSCQFSDVLIDSAGALIGIGIGIGILALIGRKRRRRRRQQALINNRH